MEKEISDREIIIQLLETMEAKPLAFARNIGVDKSTLYNVLHGRNNISNILMTKITSTYPNVNTDFLLHGRKPILINDNLKPSAQPVDKQLDNVLSIPARLSNIEAQLQQIIKLLTN